MADREDPVEPLLEMTGITTSFPGVLANDQAGLSLWAGEVLGLLGENGAGKTTLMRVLSGLQQPDSGSIHIEGSPVEIRSPADAHRLGIAMVHQNFSLSPRLTVLENVMLGDSAKKRLGRPKMKSAERELLALGEGYGLRVDPRARIQDLSVGERQRVEILKCLRDQPSILILDEPTAVLTLSEIQTLYGVIQRLTEQDRGIILITHKLEELLSATRRIAVMRKGRLVGTVPTSEASVIDLARMMVDERLEEVLSFAEIGVRVQCPNCGSTSTGSLNAPLDRCRSCSASLRRPSTREPIQFGTAGKPFPPAEASSNGDKSEPSETTGAVLLQLKDVFVTDRWKHEKLSYISFSISAGEILGVAGVEGNGQTVLADVVSGMTTPSSGRVFINGHDLTTSRPASRYAHGLATVHEDRQGAGAIPSMSVAENLGFNAVERREFSRWGFVYWKQLRREAQRLLQEYSVSTDPDAAFSMLSGGNQQRVVLARELSKEPLVLLAAQPTRGLDVSAAAYVRERLDQVRRRGGAVLLISSDLDEILSLADGIVVMHRGRIVGAVRRSEASMEKLALLMTGTDQ